MRRTWLLILFFLAGFSSLIYEICWVRQATLTFGVSVFAYSAVLTAYMLGMAIGSYLFGQRADQVTQPLRLFTWLQVGTAILGVLAPFVLNWMIGIYANIVRVLAPNLTMLTILRLVMSLIALTPPAILIGAAFPVMSRAYASESGRIGFDVGGLYVAIDTTAGERERGSLEPLLSLPVRRDALIAGKLGATVAFMLLATGISILAFTFSLRLVPFAELGIRPNIGPAVLAKVFLLLVPFAFLGAALLTFVASFTRSYREAQSWLSVVLLVPTIPIAFAGLKGMSPGLPAMLVPSLSQHLLIMELFKGASLHPLYVAVSAASTLALALLLTLAVRHRYRRETILGTT